MATLNELLYEVRRVAKSRQILDEKKIRKIYKALEKKLNGFLGDTWVKYADDDGRLTTQQLKNAGQYAKFLEEIANNVDELTSSEKTAIMTIVEDTYNKAYSGMVKAVQKADVRGDLKDVVKDINVTPDVIKRAFDNNISKLTLPTILQSHRNTIIYEIQQAVNLGLMNGDRYETVAKRVNERVGVGYSKAVRIVRTETHRNIESGFNDCAKEIQNGLDGSGFIYTATWRTMKDERVRPQVRYYTAKRGWVTKTPYKAVANHIKMEGQIIQVGGLFDLGNAKAPCPGMSGTANNDCNCRCFVEYEMMTEQEFLDRGGKIQENLQNGVEKSVEGGIIGVEEYTGIPKKWVKVDNENNELLPNVNPNYDISSNKMTPEQRQAFRENCTNCVVAAEMKRRGYDVIAASTLESNALKRKPYLAWSIDGKPIEVINVVEDGLKEIKEAMYHIPENCRFQICGNWKGVLKKGHTFYAEKIDKNIFFIDPQSNEVCNEEVFDKYVNNSIMYWRIDNADITDKGVSACRKRE